MTKKSKVYAIGYLTLTNDLLQLRNKDNVIIGNVSKNVIIAFENNEISIDNSVWYELKNGQPRIHRKNLICKI